MWRSIRNRVLPLICLAIIYAGVRLLSIDRLVTTDEPAWLGASANFYRALVTGELAHTYNLEHPGVPTMWAGALAYWIRFPEYATTVGHNLNGLGEMYAIESVLRRVGQDPLQMMIAAKTVKVLMQTVFFSIGIICLRRAIEPSIALTTAALIAFGPFLTGLDSALHVDGMAAITTFAGFCAIVLATERTNLRVIAVKPIFLWAFAGLICATAWLTRYPALLLLGVAGLGLLLQLITQRNTTSLLIQLRTSLLYGLTWLVSGLLATIAFWPALWVTPRATLVDMWNYSVEAAGQGHEHPLIFMGVVKSGDPGWLFYPVSLLWRMSITDWIGLVALVLLAIWAYRRGYLAGSLVRICIMAIIYVLVFITVQSFGAKKFDRYILPVYPLITLVASIGLDFLGRGIADLTGRHKLRVAPILLAVVLNIAIIGSIMPYRLDYFSPIMGGPKEAVTDMQMGWGQGGDQVADYLDQQAGTDPMTVQSSATSSAFSYFLPDDTPIRFRKFDIMTPAGWYETDYYVAGFQQTQRNMAPVYDVLRSYPTVFTVEIGGVPYFEVFNVRNLSLPDSLKAPTACNYRFGEQVQLMQIIGRDTTIDLYFLSLEGASEDPITVTFTLTSPSGTVSVETAEVTPTPVGTMTRVSIANPASGADMPLRDFNITISASRYGETLPATAPWQSLPIPAATTQSECYYTPAPS